MSLLQQLSDGDFTLPEKWCVRGCKEICNYLKHLHIPFASENDKNLYFKNRKKEWSCADDRYINDYGYTEITFDQFKKYVLKEDEVSDNISAVFIPERKEVDLSKCKPTEEQSKSIEEALEKIGYKKNYKDQYAVMLTDIGAPTKLHDSYESAEAECLRLVEKNKRNGYVLKVCAEINLEPKINKLCN